VSRRDSAPERLLRPFLEDPGLRIVAIAAMGVFASFGAWGLAGALRARSPFAIAALLALAWVSAAGVRAGWREGGRPGPLGLAIGAFWLLSALGAWAALRFELA
jgi:hypothetical protein